MRKVNASFDAIAVELVLNRRDITSRYWQLKKEGKLCDAEPLKKDGSRSGLAKDEVDLGEITMVNTMDDEPKKQSEPNNYHKATVEDVTGDKKTNSSTDDSKKVDAAWAPVSGAPNCSIPDWPHGHQEQSQRKGKQNYISSVRDFAQQSIPSHDNTLKNLRLQSFVQQTARRQNSRSKTPNGHVSNDQNLANQVSNAPVSNNTNNLRHGYNQHCPTGLQNQPIQHRSNGQYKTNPYTASHSRQQPYVLSARLQQSFS